jgi:hypothetical protein
MYRQGLGDCFLLTFNPDAAPVHMLVDCGTLGATTTGVTMKQVAEDILNETKGAGQRGHLHVLVLTHEHKDHVSGFGSQQAVFDKIDVDNVWVAWTEDATDDDAIELEKFEDDLMEAVALSARTLIGNAAADAAERQALKTSGEGARALLEFRGDLPDGNAPLGADFAKTVDAAMDYASKKAGGLPQFLEPEQIIEPSFLPGVRFYVLGPPRSKSALTNLGTHESPELYHLAAQLSSALTQCGRFSASELAFQPYRDGLGPVDRQMFEGTLPFDARFRYESSDEDARRRLISEYDDPHEAWRRIDYDWLAAADDLALQLDNATNNTSLVLAIEFVADGRVLLLVADAQLGNWLSWDSLTFKVPQANGTVKDVKAEDLLKRTALYKVGHHSSHNATVNDRGLELMQRDDLIAVIPVDSTVALNKRPHPWFMPAEALYTALIKKAAGRVLRSDTGWPADKPDTMTDAEWAATKANPNIVIGPIAIDVLI